MKKARGLKINQAILNLICGTGTPPTIIDMAKWKNVISTINNTITTSFVDTYIPGEVAQITEEEIQMLSKVMNLNISYDGGTTKAVKSISMIHVTTPHLQQAYLIEGNEASGVSHSSPQIANETFKFDFMLFDCSLYQILICFSRLCITVARRIFQGYPHIALEIQNWPAKLSQK